MTILGFDYGTKNIGVAVGSTHSRVAQPLTTVTVNANGPDWDSIARVIDDWNATALVVGLPFNMDDSENSMTHAARQFGADLSGRYQLPVHMVDERLTSLTAKYRLDDSGIPPKHHKTKLDEFAAREILQAFLNESHGIDFG